MRETNFIDQNKQKWTEFEQEFYSEKNDPEKVSNLFIQITDDLSYSRTYYPNRSIKIYLNNLAQKVYYAIYKNKVRRRKKLVNFWKDDLPRLMYESRMQLLFSFCLFMLSFFIGVFSSQHDPDFARLILGDSYVQMTKENIESGDPMKVYKDMNQVDMFLGITINNLRVAFITFILGIILGIGTSVFIIYNGVMVGAFQYFFIERGLFRESFLTIWVHGALEISAIVIAGAAGITLGKSLLFPGTYTRSQSFRIGALRGIQILLGIAPVIILAAFIESFLTRYTEVPDFIRALIIAIEFTFMITYYVVYPRRKAAKGFTISARPDDAIPDVKQNIQFNTIKTSGEIFSDSFILYKTYINSIARYLFFLAAIYSGVYVFLIKGVENIYTTQWVIRELGNLFDYDNSIYLFALHVISFAFILLLSVFCIKNSMLKNSGFSTQHFLRFVLKQSLLFVPVCAAFFAIPFLNKGIAYILLLIAFPYLCMLLCYTGTNNNSFLNNVTQAKIFRANIGTLFTLYISVLLVCFMLLQLFDSGFTYLHLEIIKWNIPFNETVYRNVTQFLLTLLLVYGFFMLLPLIIFNMSLLYFNTREIFTAVELKRRLQFLGDIKYEKK